MGIQNNKTGFVVKGVMPALATPLFSDMTVNEKAFRKLIRHVMVGGVHGIHPGGTTGEFYGLTFEQKREVLEISLDEVKGCIPIYFGAGAVTTPECIRLANMAEDCGADALSVLTPFFISPSQEEIYRHYKMIAENTGLPVVLYNNYPKTRVGIEAQTVARLAEIKNIVAIKDSSGDFTMTEAYINETRDQDFKVLSGRDNMILNALKAGAAGAISSNCNIAPGICTAIYESFVVGDMVAAAKAQEQLTQIRSILELGTFPASIKEALIIIGIDAGPCFMPIGPLTAKEKAKLYEVLELICQ